MKIKFYDIEMDRDELRACTSLGDAFSSIIKRIISSIGNDDDDEEYEEVSDGENE